MGTIHRGIFAMSLRSSFSSWLRPSVFTRFPWHSRATLHVRAGYVSTIEIEQKRAAGHVWSRLIVMDLARSIDLRSMYSSANRPDFLSFSDTVFQGESPDEHAARIQVSAGERRDAAHRRQSPSRHTLAQERSLLFCIQGDESFLMESLSIHLLSLIIVGDSRRR